MVYHSTSSPEYLFFSFPSGFLTWQLHHYAFSTYQLYHYSSTFSLSIILNFLLFRPWNLLPAFQDFSYFLSFFGCSKSALTEMKSHPGMKLAPGWKNFCLHVSFIPGWNEQNFIPGWNLIWKKTSHWEWWKYIIKFLIFLNYWNKKLDMLKTLDD